MGKLVSSAVLLLIAFSLLLAAATLRSQRPGPVVNLLRLAGYVVAAIALAVGAGSLLAVIDPGEVGVRHAFGYTDPAPLLAGIRYVPPWSSIERYSTREEQWPTRGEQIEAIEALSSEQMGMHVEVSIRWQIDPMQAPKIFTEIGDEDQIRGAVLNAIRKGVRDGMDRSASESTPRRASPSARSRAPRSLRSARRAWAIAPRGSSSARSTTRAARSGSRRARATGPRSRRRVARPPRPGRSRPWWTRPPPAGRGSPRRSPRSGAGWRWDRVAQSERWRPRAGAKTR